MTRKFLSRKVQDILQSGGNTPLTIEEIFSKLDEDCTMGTLKSVLNGMVDHHKDYLGSSKDIAYYKVNNSKGYFKKGDLKPQLELSNNKYSVTDEYLEFSKNQNKSLSN